MLKIVGYIYVCLWGQKKRGTRRKAVSDKGNVTAVMNKDKLNRRRQEEQLLRSRFQVLICGLDAQMNLFMCGLMTVDETFVPV